MLVSVLTLVACAAPQTREILAARLEGRSVRQRLELPFFPQTEYQCGPAALAGLLGYYGVEATPEGLTPEVFLPERRGSLQLELKAAARQRGLIALPLAALPGKPMSRLLAALDQDQPVLVLQNLGLALAPQWHYALVTGYDFSDSVIILNSGIDEGLRADMSRFEHTWRRGDFWGLLLARPDQIPRAVAAEDWLAAVFESEQTGQLAVTHQAYSAAARQWPDSESAKLGAGNTAYGLKKYEVAAEYYFSLAVSNGEQSATGWNNLAHVLMEARCLPEARAAIAQAEALDGGAASIKATRRSISLSARAPDTLSKGTSVNESFCADWQGRFEEGRISVEGAI